MVNQPEIATFRYATFAMTSFIMSLFRHHNHHIHRFLANKEMNELYLSYGISTFSLSLISVFVPIYLYKLGYSLPGVMFYYLLLPISFVIFSFVCARIVSRIGVKHSMLLATPIMIVYLMGLRVLGQWPVLFFILPTILAIKSALYFYSFHLNFVQHSDSKSRGKEVSMLQAVALAASLVSPFVGGIIAKYFGFGALFTVGSVLLAVSLVPLFLTKDSYEKISFSKEKLFREVFSRENLPLTLSFSGYAIENWIGYVIWPIFLYLIFANIESVGLVATLTASITFLIFYIVAKKTDDGDKRGLIKTGAFLYFWGWVGRLFANSFLSVVLIDTYANISSHILQIPWSAYTYDLATRRNYFKFIVQREITFNLSRIIVVPFIILIFLVDFHPYVFSFAVAAMFSLLYPALNKVGVESPVLTVQAEEVK